MIVFANLPGLVPVPAAPVALAASSDWLVALAATTAASSPPGDPETLAEPIALPGSTPDVAMPAAALGPPLRVIAPLPRSENLSGTAAARSDSPEVEGEQVAPEIATEDDVEHQEASGVIVLAAPPLLPVLSPVTTLTADEAVPPPPENATVPTRPTSPATFDTRVALSRESVLPDAPVVPAAPATPRRSEVAPRLLPDGPADPAGMASHGVETALPVLADRTPTATATGQLQTLAAPQPFLAPLLPTTVQSPPIDAWAPASPPSPIVGTAPPPLVAPAPLAAQSVPPTTPVSVRVAAQSDPTRRMILPGATPVQAGAADRHPRLTIAEELPPFVLQSFAFPAAAPSPPATPASTAAPADTRFPAAEPLPAPTALMTADAMIVATDRLGAVRVAIEAADGLAVALSVDRGTSAALLGAAADRLDTALAASGQRLDALSVDVRGGDGGRRAPPPPLAPTPPAPANATPTPAARPRRDRYA